MRYDCRYLRSAMENKKKNATGVRFNEEKLNFVMAEENLKTPQKVVNFLLDKYWWEKKIGYFPTLERQPVVEETKAQPPKEPVVDDFKTKTEQKIKDYEEEMKHLGAGSVAAQRRAFVQKELSALKRLLG